MKPIQEENVHHCEACGHFVNDQPSSTFVEMKKKRSLKYFFMKKSTRSRSKSKKQQQSKPILNCSIHSLSQTTGENILSPLEPDDASVSRYSKADVRDDISVASMASKASITSMAAVSSVVQMIKSASFVSKTDESVAKDSVTIGNAMLLDENDENATTKTDGEDKQFETADEKEEETEEDQFNIERVDTMHADITIPLSAKSGEWFTVDHDGQDRQIMIPAGGYQGQSIRVKMIKNKEEELSTGAFCGCDSVTIGNAMLLDENDENATTKTDGEDKQFETADEKEEETEEDQFNIERVDTMHADITIPLSAKSGEWFTVDHDGQDRQIMIPAGGYQGQSIRVKMIKNKEEELSTGAFCGCA